MPETNPFIETSDGVIPMREDELGNEANLQALIEQEPGLLPREDRAKDPRWMHIQREFGVPDAESAGNRWAVDHLFVDGTGIPTFVETKLATNPEARRKIIGQMLDYAANGEAHWSIHSIKSALTARLAEHAANEENAAELELAEVARVTGVDHPDAGAFWDRVGENLRTGKVRLVFAADELPVEARRVIEFLNRQMRPAEVLGLEVRRFVDRDGANSVLVPSVHGRTEETRLKKASTETRQTDPLLQRAFDRFKENAESAPWREELRFGNVGDQHYKSMGIAGCAWRTVHYEWTRRKKGRELSVGLHFEQSNAGPTNEANAEAVRQQIEAVAQKHGFKPDIGLMGSVWARAEVRLATPDENDPVAAKQAADIMYDVIDATFDQLGNLAVA